MYYVYCKSLFDLAKRTVIYKSEDKKQVKEFIRLIYKQELIPLNGIEVCKKININVK